MLEERGSTLVAVLTLIRMNELSSGVVVTDQARIASIVDGSYANKGFVRGMLVS